MSPTEPVAAAGSSSKRCVAGRLDAARVEEVRGRLPDPAAEEQLARIFRVLAEPSRLRIVIALLEAGELCVCDIAAAVGLSETSTSQHLRVLRGERAVRNRRDGRTIFYALADAHVRLLVDVSLAHVTEERC